MPEKLYALLNYFAELGSEQLYRRFAYLDEEYQLAMIAGLIEVYDLEEFEGLNQEEQDTLHGMPCGQVYYRIVTEDESTHNFIRKLMTAVTEHNPRYAYALLGHASFALRSEHEESIRRFRQARLEEDGYVSYEESLTCFQPLDSQVLRNKYKNYNYRQGVVSQGQQQELYLMEVLSLAQQRGWSIDDQYTVHQGLLFLANSLCSAAQVEPEDLHGLNRILEQCRALVGLWPRLSV